jgi:hypothetical protein
MLEIIGGLDRDRTDDLFHAMELVKPQIIDDTALTSRLSRQDRQNRDVCCQNAAKFTISGPPG